ncbi:hypothetical protein P7K49_000137 [Saguinus oedipus]|uniref:Uncharacterized protein n=1 Tax=Saguinus oedipus TaxID=9490 RepID=A0ABQ9WAU4_SAGOE|nr:hypothetical protein P7K49_000137 [Saguinus oedipus]
MSSVQRSADGRLPRLRSSPSLPHRTQRKALFLRKLQPPASPLAVDPYSVSSAKWGPEGTARGQPSGVLPGTLCNTQIRDWVGGDEGLGERRCSEPRHQVRGNPSLAALLLQPRLCALQPQVPADPSISRRNLHPLLEDAAWTRRPLPRSTRLITSLQRALWSRSLPARPLAPPSSSLSRALHTRTLANQRRSRPFVPAPAEGRRCGARRFLGSTAGPARPRGAPGPAGMETAAPTHPSPRRTLVFRVDLPHQRNVSLQVERQRLDGVQFTRWSCSPLAGLNMVHPGGPRRLGAAFRFLHPPPPLKNSTAKCKALALPAHPRRLQPRPGGYICRARPPLTGPRGPQRLGARAAVVVVPRRTARPAAQAPSQAAGLARGAARTSAHTRVGEGPAPRPPPPTRPPGCGGERRGEGSGKGRAPLADEPHLSNVENPNTSFKHLGNIQPRCAARMRPSPLPRQRPRPPPH